jgi:MFS family permease
MLKSSATTPSWGKISDIFGRKPMLLAANVIFLIGSLLCAVSISTRMLIAGRGVQGVGGGGLTVLVNICTSDLFSLRLVNGHYLFVFR